MSESLKRALRADIAVNDAMLSTTPHLSRIYHAEVALLRLLEEPVRPAPLPDESGGRAPPVQREIITFVVEGERPFHDTPTPVEALDGKGPL